MTETIGFAADCDQSVASFILQANSGKSSAPQDGAEIKGHGEPETLQEYADLAEPSAEERDRAPFDLREGEAPLLESLEKFRGGIHRTSLFKMEEQIMNESVKTKKALRGSLLHYFCASYC